MKIKAIIEYDNDLYYLETYTNNEIFFKGIHTSIYSIVETLEPYLGAITYKQARQVHELCEKHNCVIKSGWNVSRQA
jgi:hypothetical protein